MQSASSNLRALAHSLFLDALADCDVGQAVRTRVSHHVDESGEKLLILGELSLRLTRLKNIGVISVGKAAIPMLDAILPDLQALPGCKFQGVLIAPQTSAKIPAGFQFFAGGHPLPNEASRLGAYAALELIDSLKAGRGSKDDTLCLFLISGGASAMMELPLDPTISLDDTARFYRELVHSGGSITEINCIRKHFSAVKGGRLAAAAEGLTTYSLLVSDVPAGELDVLGSGPTVPDTSTWEQCNEILTRLNLLERCPESVQTFFASPHLPETPKPHQLEVRAATLLTSDDLAHHAKRRAEELGLYTVIDNTCDDWDYRSAADYLLDRLRTLRRDHPRLCILSSGEITVALPNAVSSGADGSTALSSGTGGRNQHFALYAATRLRPSDGPVVVLSAGSDGIDGNSTAAGAIIDELTLAQSSAETQRQTEAGQSSFVDRAEAALRHFDSGTFLKAVGCDLVTGPTGNNLRDLRILIAE